MNGPRFVVNEKSEYMMESRMLDSSGPVRNARRRAIPWRSLGGDFTWTYRYSSRDLTRPEHNRFGASFVSLYSITEGG